MNIDIILAIVFYGILMFFFFKYRSKFDVQSKIFIMYRTKWGLNLMERIAKKFPRTLNVFSYISIFIGFVGMALIVGFLVFGTVKLIYVPESQPVLSPVLPGVKIPGLPVLSFWHWIISILLVATIHETCHGIYSRLNKIKLKSSGFAFLGPILAAFVEPDEKQLERSSKHAQLSVLSAGPFSNILSGFIILVIGFLLIAPAGAAVTETSGVQIIDISKEYPIKDSGLTAGKTIDKINNIEINNVKDFVEVMENTKPNEEITITSNGEDFKVITSPNPKDSSKAILGVTVTHAKVGIKENIQEKYGSFLPRSILWLSELIFWLYAISLGVGLFNLLPLGPVDGGKMFYVGMLHIFKDSKKAMKIYHFTSLFILLLIFVNLLPYLIKLLAFFFNGVLLLF